MDLQHVRNLDEGIPLIPVALTGSGPALDALIDVLSRNELSRLFPRLRIRGWVADPPAYNGGSSDPPPALGQIPRFNDIPALFKANPDIMLAADLSPDSRHMAQLRAVAAPGITLVSSSTVLAFCALFSEARLHAAGQNLRLGKNLFTVLVDQIKGDMLIMDRDCNVLDANLHAAQSAGMHVADMIGLNCKELNKTAGFCVCDEEQCPFLQSKVSGRQSMRVFSQVTSEGRVRYMETSCYPFVDSTGDRALYLYIRRDVTEQHHLEQRLQQTEKMAAIGELSTYVAHEIRNPLFAIGGFANALLRNSSLNDIAREKARIIYDESRRLDIILTNILNFARPTQQVMGEFDAGAIARQTMDLMTLGGEERNIVTEADIRPGLPKALGNAENLKQCLVNIIKNAIEAMPCGGCLKVSASLADNFIRIDVTDSGEGIKPEVQDHIFNPFFSTKNSGSGLGLAMTRKVIEEMGGKVSFESAQGKGATISLFVPVALDLAMEAQDRQNGA